MCVCVGGGRREGGGGGRGVGWTCSANKPDTRSLRRGRIGYVSASRPGERAVEGVLCVDCAACSGDDSRSRLMQVDVTTKHFFFGHTQRTNVHRA